jgi:hypothetical protein
MASHALWCDGHHGVFIYRWLIPGLFRNLSLFCMACCKWQMSNAGCLYYMPRTTLGQAFCRTDAGARMRAHRCGRQIGPTNARTVAPVAEQATRKRPLDSSGVFWSSGLVGYRDWLTNSPSANADVLPRARPKTLRSSSAMNTELLTLTITPQSANDRGAVPRAVCRRPV